jgi:hypothetical protein
VIDWRRCGLAESLPETSADKERAEGHWTGDKEDVMDAPTKKWNWGALARPLMLLPALVVALSLVFTGSAAAQTPFQASVTSTGNPHVGCLSGAFFCGTANIAGYGAATWNFGNVTNPTLSDTPCGTTYTATTTFTLLSDPSSTLVLDESGNICGLGHDGAAYRGYFAEGPNAAGHPYTIVGAPSASVPDGGWIVDSASTGQFSQFAGSTGTDLMNTAGGYLAGTYTGTLG